MSLERLKSRILDTVRHICLILNEKLDFISLNMCRYYMEQHDGDVVRMVVKVYDIPHSSTIGSPG